jgi:hypothetical protein
MTPLAMEIVNNLLLPKNKRIPTDLVNLASQMTDVHCFEVSDIFGVADEIMTATLEHDLVNSLLFLPAPKTWIEFKTEGRQRVGFLLAQHAEGVLTCCIASGAMEGPYSFSTFPKPLMASLKAPFHVTVSEQHNLVNSDVDPDVVRRIMEKADASKICDSMQELLPKILVCINSPRVFGQKTHLPHRGLQRELIKQQKLVGRFSLQAWTEIVLEVRPPQNLVDETGCEAHLTGRKALHFVRAHVRIKQGRLEWVSSHWRGDAALGIKRSRYKLRNGVPS